jgi:hypothetical protein
MSQIHKIWDLIYEIKNTGAKYLFIKIEIKIAFIHVKVDHIFIY